MWIEKSSRDHPLLYQQLEESDGSGLERFIEIERKIQHKKEYLVLVEKLTVDCKKIQEQKAHYVKIMFELRMTIPICFTRINCLFGKATLKEE